MQKLLLAIIVGGVGLHLSASRAADSAPVNPVRVGGAIATTDESDVNAKTVPMPAATRNVNLTLDLGYDVTAPQMSFNDALVVLSNIEDFVVVVAPELSDPAVGNKMLNLTPGRIQLRNFIEQVCAQVGASWSIDENQAIVLSAIAPIQVQVAVAGDGQRQKIDIDFAGVPLGLAAANLTQRTGVVIRVEDNVRDLPIEIIVQGWEIDRILKYLSDMYPLVIAREGDNAFVISKRVDDDDEEDYDRDDYDSSE